MLTRSLPAELGPVTAFASVLSRPATIIPLAKAHDPGIWRERHSTGVSAAGVGIAAAGVEISSSNPIHRHAVAWPGMTGDLVQSSPSGRIESRFRAPLHLLVVHEQGARRTGETFVEGLPRSTRRDFSGRLTFVPAGLEYWEWQELRAPSRTLYLSFDLPEPGGREEGSRVPRLFFQDATLWDTAIKLGALIGSPERDNNAYLEALGLVLRHEVLRLGCDASGGPPSIRGGLAAWQERTVAAFIEEHLGEAVSLATLSKLARLSPYYFCRAFRQSFGMPPHRYHTNRRIERAKLLLADRAPSITDIGFVLGFSQTSSFTAAFRKSVGITPRDYRRRFS